MSEVKNSFTNKSTGEVRVGRHRYVRTEISEKKITKLLAIFGEHWKEEGFEISASNSRVPSLSGKASDGSVVGFTVGGAGDVDISAGTGALSDGPSGDVEGEEGDKAPKAPSNRRGLFHGLGQTVTDSLREHRQTSPATTTAAPALRLDHQARPFRRLMASTRARRPTRGYGESANHHPEPPRGERPCTQQSDATKG